MKYEIVIDRLFFVNLLLNYILLYSTIRLLHIRVQRIRLLSAAAIGSGGLCLSFLLPFSKGYGRILFLCGIIFPLMICVMLKGKNCFSKLTAGCVYVAGIVIVGKFIEILGFIFNHKLENIKFILLAGCGISFGVLRLIGFLKRNHCKETCFCKVVLRIEGKDVMLDGLVDTGNLLNDPFFHKPVHILEERVIWEEFQATPLEALPGFHLIPYRTIGNQGLLSVFEVEELTIIAGKGQIQLDKQLCAVSPKSLSENNKYQLIVNKGAW